MIYLIDGASCSGKTYLAQNLMQKLAIPYYSIDHIKMGFFRTNQLTTISDDAYVSKALFPFLKEMLLTILENHQSVILEGCYFEDERWISFMEEHKEEINYTAIIISQDYIKNHFNKIIDYRNVIENRMYPEHRSMHQILEEHNKKLLFCKTNNLNYLYITDDYLHVLESFVAQQTSK